jgi:sulfhydrogenase subunit alpha
MVIMAKKTTKSLNVDLRHLTRVEGHGNIVVEVDNGVLKQCDLEIIEAPRYFEAMLKGRSYTQASLLASRICGICAVAHATTSLRAVEKALGVELTPQTESLRLLNYLGEILDSHILHIYMLVAPDFFEVGSVFPLIKSSPEVVTRALRMKKLAGDICATICGRHTHPIAMTVGGFTQYPSMGELLSLRERLEATRQDIEATVDLFQGLTLPAFDRDTEYLALQKEEEYCFIDGAIASTDGGQWPVEAYREVTNEFLVDHSTAKHARYKHGAYMVGALARFNINSSWLHPQAKAAASALDLQPKCTNPFKNTVAQVVETVHCFETAIQILDELVEIGVQWEWPAAPTLSFGQGVGACEAPRGTLYHHYVIDAGGITEANCIIPTAQNLANIEADMRAFVTRMLSSPQEKIEHGLEMLVRAYDPCISCSAH